VNADRPPAAAVTIIGRGVAGLACAIAMVDTGRVSPAEVVTVDPVDGWLSQWDERLERLGVTHLRSSTFQHPDTDARALERYLTTHPSPDVESDGFLRHPSPAVFSGFCRHLIDTKLAGAVRHRGRVAAIRQEGNGLVVVTGDGTAWWSKHVVLATNPRARQVPMWAMKALAHAAHTVVHTDDLRPREHLHDDRPIVVVGGGNTAAGLAVDAATHAARVVLVARRPLRGQRFDVTPGWMSATVYGAFDRVQDPLTRLRLADAAASGGTVPPPLLRRLRHLQAAGGIDVRDGVRITAGQIRHGRLSLDLSDGTRIGSATVWLATGSIPTLAGAPRLMLSRPITFLRRFPLLDGHLRVPGTNLFIVGGLARIVVGPTAGNLHGHRHAARRVAAAIG